MRERMAYQRVLLKLSGEALMGDQGHGIDPAIVNAIRQATGRELPRVPVRPSDICL